MSPLHDLVVGVVAVIVGSLLMLGALTDSQLLMTLAKPQYLAQKIGKTAASWTIAAIGLATIAIGVLIASGWRINW